MKFFNSCLNFLKNTQSKWKWKVKLIKTIMKPFRISMETLHCKKHAQLFAVFIPEFRVFFEFKSKAILKYLKYFICFQVFFFKVTSNLKFIWINSLFKRKFWQINRLLLVFSWFCFVLEGILRIIILLMAVCVHWTWPNSSRQPW